MGSVVGWQEAPEGTLLQNVNMEMAREEYGLNGQQGLDELLSVFAGDEIQVLNLCNLPAPACHAYWPSVLFSKPHHVYGGP